MISVEEATRCVKEWARERAGRWGSERLPLSEAVGRILSHSVRAEVSLPHFDNSAMDGYAVCSEATRAATLETPLLLPVGATLRAGEAAPAMPDPRNAVKIMTGAPIPQGADAVIPNEDVIEKPEGVRITEPVQPGSNIRRKGEDLREGETAVEAGERISPGVVTCLSALGVCDVKVAALPRVSLVVTGCELVRERGELGPGKVLESNSMFLRSALQELRIHPHRVAILGDDEASIRGALQSAMEDSDVILVTGGVSVGEYDYTRRILSQLGAQELFWKVAQKPGKPLYAGWKKDTLIFGLPGNPYAVFACYYAYVRAALLSLMGAMNVQLSSAHLPLDSEVSCPGKRARWLKGRTRSAGGRLVAHLLSGQGSHQVASLVEANILIYIPGERDPVPGSEDVNVFFLPM